MKRPLVGVACLFVGGVLLGDQLEPPLAALFAACGFVLLASLVCGRLRPVLLALLVALMGWTGYTLQTTALSPFDLRRLISADAELVTLRGQLVETPTWRIRFQDETGVTNTLAVIEVAALNRNGAWQPAVGRVVVNTRGPVGTNWFAGRVVEIEGAIETPSGSLADGLLDYRHYLARRGVYYQLRAESEADWRHADPADRPPPVPPLADRFRDWAQRTLAMGLPAEDESLRLNWAMVLGWKTALTDEVTAPFMRSGTMHIFAISGLHIALIAGILVHLLRGLRVPRGACGFVVIPIIWFYTLATGWQASAIRSTLMMTLVIGGWSLRRPVDLLNSLAAAAVIILAWDPRQLFQASFQLSFCVVLGMALLLPPLEQWRQRWLRHDPLLPDELRPRWRRWLDPPVRAVTTALATSLAAWLGSLPLVAWYFHLFTPVSLLANLIVVPLSGLALMSSLGSLLCGDWLPALTVAFNHSGWFWMKLMVAASERCAALPGAYCYVPAPGLIASLIYYALVAALMSGWALEQNRWKWIFGALGAVCLAALVAGAPCRGEVVLTVLPLRGGDAICVDAPGRANDALIDCGDDYAVQRIVTPVLRSKGWNRLPALVLTHGDVRHVGGAGEIGPEFRLCELVTSGARFRSTPYNDAVRQIESTGAVGRVVLKRGDPFGPWRVLHPAPEDRFTLADDNALVLLGEFHGTRVLLVSDLGRAGQAALLEREPELRADIVIAGMPNAGEPLGARFLEAVNPRAVVLSTGQHPASERPTLALRARLTRSGALVWFTGDRGAIELRLCPSGWSIRSRIPEEEWRPPAR